MTKKTFEMKIRFESVREFNLVNNLVKEMKGKQSRNEFLKDLILKATGQDQGELNLYKREINNLTHALQDVMLIAHAAEATARTLTYIYMAHNKIEASKILSLIDLSKNHKTLEPVTKYLDILNSKKVD